MSSQRGLVASELRRLNSQSSICTVVPSIDVGQIDDDLDLIS